MNSTLMSLLPPDLVAGIGGTPLMRCSLLAPSGNLYLKVECLNPGGSVKDRTALGLIAGLAMQQRLSRHIRVVESSSGNLGLSLARQLGRLGVPFVCVVDSDLNPAKIEEITRYGAIVELVTAASGGDSRELRIEIARKIGSSKHTVWTNQYANAMNVWIHSQTTAAEILTQLGTQPDVIVCAVGTGGTLCGIARRLNSIRGRTTLIAVEPTGSTIFGGTLGPYVSAGAGLLTASPIVLRYRHLIDYCCKVPDSIAFEWCRISEVLEHGPFGLTSGAVLSVATRISRCRPELNVIAMLADAGRYEVPVGTQIHTEGWVPKLSRVAINAKCHDLLELSC